VLNFNPEEETKMDKKCKGKWRIELTFDGSGNETERGSMSIEPEDEEGNFEGDHFDEGNPASKKLRKGKCKDDKIHFERAHKDGGLIIHDGDVTSDEEMNGTFKIVAVDSHDESQGGGSKHDGKDKNKKDRDPGDTGTWTGVKEGL
jgi:hypothetical protein